MAQASQALGISPKTLRRWADAGRIPVAVTAGGHRRFEADHVGRFAGHNVTAEDPRAIVARLVAVAAGRHRETIDRLPRSPVGLTPAQRASLRARGALVLGALLGDLAGSGRPRDRTVRAACRLGSDYGRDLALAGLPLPGAVATFLAFESAFLDEVVRMLRSRGPARHEPLGVLVAAQRASSSVLRAFIEGHIGAGGAVERST